MELAGLHDAVQGVIQQADRPGDRSRAPAPLVRRAADHHQVSTAALAMLCLIVARSRPHTQNRRQREL